MRSVLLILLVFTGTPVAAQSASSPQRNFLRVGGGIAFGQATAGGGTSTAFGPILSGHVGIGGHRVRFVFDAEAQPFRVANPVRAEAYRVVFAMPSFEVTLSNLHLRAGVGAGFYWYSGSDVFTSTDAGLAWALTAGWRPTSWLDGRFAVEAGAIGGSSSDGELRASSYSIRMLRYLGG